MVPPDVKAEERFTFPVGRSWFGAACGVLPVAIAAAVLLPYLGPWALAFFGAVAPAIAGFLWCPRWLLPRSVTLTDDGIATRRRSIRWEELTEIRKGWLRVNPFTLLRAAQPRRLILPPYPVVLRQVLPAILRRRGDVVVSKSARRALADPEKATRIPRWTGLILLAAAAASTGVALSIRYGSLWWPMAGGMAMLMLLQVAIFASPVPCTQTHAMVQSSLLAGGAGCFLILTLTPLGSILFDLPFFATDASIAAAGALFLAAGAVVLGRLPLRPLHKAVIVAFIVGLPLLVHQLGARSALRRTDVTDLFGGETTWPPFWSEDSALAASLIADGSRGERHAVADLAALRSVPLPAHEGSQWMVWLDRACACRMVREEGHWGLYLFRFGSGQETRLSTTKGSPLPSLRHMSPDGRRLCWLAPSEKDRPCALKTCDLEADRIEELDIEWPGDKDITWCECGWADGDTLIVWGYGGSPAADPERQSPKSLQVLRVGYKDRTVRREGSSRRFADWRISPDGRYAFACGPEGDARPGVYFLDLRDGRTHYIGGEELPVWDADARVALRISRFYGQEEWLCRFDVAKAAETPVLKIPRGEKLVAASPGGRFAILRDRGPLRLKPLSLVNLATGQRLRLPASGAGTCSLEWRRVNPWQSTFSPDGVKFVLPAFTPRHPFGVRLYSVPEEWLN